MLSGTNSLADKTVSFRIFTASFEDISLTLILLIVSSFMPFFKQDSLRAPSASMDEMTGHSLCPTDAHGLIFEYFVIVAV